MSEYFRYTEEYVLEHHILWIERKFNHANRQKYENRRIAQQDLIKAQFAVLDATRNSGKNLNQYILPDYEDAIEGKGNEVQEEKHEHDPNDFIKDPMALMPHLKLDVDGDEV